MDRNTITGMGWTRLTWLQVGSALCLPLLGVAYEVAAKFGVGIALAAILAGNFLLFCLGHLAAHMSIKHRLPTTEQSERLVGTTGKQIFSLVLTAVATGWFAIQLQYVSTQILLIGGWDWKIGVQLIAVGLATFMVTANYWGIEGIARWAEKTTPLLIAALLIMLVHLCWNGKAPDAMPVVWSWSALALSQILALNIAYTIDLPTFLRFSTTRSDAVKTNFITILVVFSLVEAAGVLVYWCCPAPSILKAFSSVPGAFWASLLTFYLIFQIWATNHMNLYSAQTSLRVCFPKLNEKQAWAATALFSIALCGLPLLDQLMDVLMVLGVLVAGIGGIIYCEYALISWKPGLERANIPASTSVALGFSYLAGWWQLSEAAIFDAFVASWISYMSMRGFLQLVGVSRERRMDYAG